MRYKEITATAPKEVLANDHFVAIPYTVPAAGVEANADGYKIVPAGTILPANDATAVGVLLHDTDVTDGDRTDAIVVHGFIKSSVLPTAPSAAAKAALPLVKFVGDSTQPDYTSFVTTGT
jgi:hypothetical protein